MSKETISITIQPTATEDIPDALGLINSVPEAVLPLTEQQLQQRIDAGLSYVAKNEEGTIVGHQSAIVWEQSGIPEIGSAVVAEECRGNGISTRLKTTVIKRVQSLYPDKPIVAFTEAASKSRGIVQRLNFEPVSMDSIPEEFFGVCPKSEDRCYGKTKSSPPDCGCVIFMLKPKGKAK